MVVNYFQTHKRTIRSQLGQNIDRYQLQHEGCLREQFIKSIIQYDYVVNDI